MNRIFISRNVGDMLRYCDLFNIQWIKYYIWGWLKFSYVIYVMLHLICYWIVEYMTSLPVLCGVLWMLLIFPRYNKTHETMLFKISNYYAYPLVVAGELDVDFVVQKYSWKSCPHRTLTKNYLVVSQSDQIWKSV